MLEREETARAIIARMDAAQREQLRAWAHALVEGRAPATEDRLWAAGRAILMLLDELERVRSEAERREREDAERLDELLHEQTRRIERERQSGQEESGGGAAQGEESRRRWWQQLWPGW